MKTFIFGTIFGIVISTVGISGIASVADKGVHFIESVSAEVF